MKAISVSVSESDYEAFRSYAARHDRSIAELVREAMALYRKERLTPMDRLERLPVVRGLKPLGELPTKSEIYDELTSRQL